MIPEGEYRLPKSMTRSYTRYLHVAKLETAQHSCIDITKKYQARELQATRNYPSRRPPLGWYMNWCVDPEDGGFIPGVGWLGAWAVLPRTELQCLQRMCSLMPSTDLLGRCRGVGACTVLVLPESVRFGRSCHRHRRFQRPLRARRLPLCIGHLEIGIRERDGTFSFDSFIS